MIKLNLIGQKFGRLLVIGLLPERDKRQRKRWLCRCECGNETITISSQLRSEKTRSCGCLQRESVIAKNKATATHGMKKSITYASWRGMYNRCYNSKVSGFHIWGGKGIHIDSRWLGPNGFINFLADMGERPSRDYTLDRIDNNKDYTPENCRWVTKVEQARNRKTVKLSMEKANKIRDMSMQGVQQCWLAKIFGVSESVISMVVHNQAWKE